MPLDNMSKNDLKQWIGANKPKYPIYVKIDTLSDCNEKYKYMEILNQKKLEDLAHIYYLETQVTIITKENYKKVIGTFGGAQIILTVPDYSHIIYNIIKE